jgi:hypothetical protein
MWLPWDLAGTGPGHFSNCGWSAYYGVKTLHTGLHKIKY